MSDDAYTELAGRIEGVVITLALLVAQRTLRELAGQMDQARAWRRRLDEGTHGVVLAFRPRDGG